MKPLVTVVSLVDDPTTEPLDHQTDVDGLIAGCRRYYHMVVCVKLSRERMLAILLVSCFYLNKHRWFTVSRTRPKVSCMDRSTCVVLVVVNVFFGYMLC